MSVGMSIVSRPRLGGCFILHQLSSDESAYSSFDVPSQTCCAGKTVPLLYFDQKVALVCHNVDNITGRRGKKIYLLTISTSHKPPIQKPDNREWYAGRPSRGYVVCEDEKDDQNTLRISPPCSRPFCAIT